MPSQWHTLLKRFWTQSIHPYQWRWKSSWGKSCSNENLWKLKPALRTQRILCKLSRTFQLILHIYLFSLSDWLTMLTLTKLNNVGTSFFRKIIPWYKWFQAKKSFLSKPFFVIAILRFLLYRIKLKFTKKRDKISKGSTLKDDWISKYHCKIYSLYPI